MKLLVFLLFLTVSECIFAADWHFQLVDSSGRAVPDAVIEILTPVTPELQLRELQPPELQPPELQPVVHTIDQVNKRFVPSSLLITRGDLVRFPNSDNIRHHVYSFSDAKTFELKLYASTPEAPVSFDIAGLAVLGCNIHDTMVGYIYVAQSSQVTRTNADGVGLLPRAENITEVRYWHPRMTEEGLPPGSLAWGGLKVVSGEVVKLVMPVKLEPAAQEVVDKFQAFGG